jgi:SnoaL-like domain
MPDAKLDALDCLLDESSCRDVITRYSAAIDWADRRSLETVFWPDAHMDFGAGFYVGSAPDGLEFLMASVNSSLCRTHSLGSIWLKLEGQRARAETPAFNLWVSRNPDASLTRYFFTARYLWQLEKRGGEWRVSALQILINTAQCTAYDPAQQPPGLPLREGMSPEHALYPGVHH